MYSVSGCGVGVWFRSQTLLLASTSLDNNHYDLDYCEPISLACETLYSALGLSLMLLSCSLCSLCSHLSSLDSPQTSFLASSTSPLYGPIPAGSHG